MKNKTAPKVLIFDIETSQLEGVMWDIWEQNIPMGHLKHKEWSIIAFSAKWLYSDKIIYSDTRNKKNKRDDKTLVKELRDLLDQADIIITKNGKRFDEKMFNGRCAKYRILPPSPHRHTDVERIVRSKFKLLSYSLEYLCYYFDTKHQKLKHANFPGMILWIECMKGNKKAWEEMEKYNKHDVLSTEDVYNIVKIWDRTINLQVYNENEIPQCNCSSTKLQKRGYNFSNTGKFQRYQCRECGNWLSSKQNLLTKEKRKALLK